MREAHFEVIEGPSLDLFKKQAIRTASALEMLEEVELGVFPKKGFSEWPAKWRSDDVATMNLLINSGVIREVIE